MARKAGGKPPKAATVPAGDTETQDPVKVNLYEPGALKHALDDLARCVIIDAGYEEDLWISNVKTGTGLAAIAVALYAQFGPGKFPANWWMVFACVVSYVLLTLVLNWFCTTYEGDAFLVTKTHKGLKVASRMQRFATDYTLVLAPRDNPEREIEKTVSVTEYFHSDGYLAEEAWRGVVEATLAEYEEQVAAESAGQRRSETKKTK